MTGRRPGAAKVQATFLSEKVEGKMEEQAKFLRSCVCLFLVCCFLKLSQAQDITNDPGMYTILVYIVAIIMMI